MLGVDLTSCRAHQHAAGTRKARPGPKKRTTPRHHRPDEGLGRSRGGLTCKIHLVWGADSAKARSSLSLLLTTRFGNAIAVNTWNTHTWKPALAKAGIIPPHAEGAKKWQWEAAPKDGFQVLRHTYASIMLEAGESVVTVARRARALLAGNHPRLLCSLHA